MDDFSEKLDLLNEELTKFFVTANIPFLQVENPHLSKFIKMLLDFKISYKPPCRISLGGKLLQSLKTKIDNNKHQLLQNEDCVLLVDGWRNKNSNKKLLVFTLKSIMTQQTLLSYADVSQEVETGENLSIHIKDAIDLASTKYSARVFAIISDNDSKIKKGVRLSRMIDNDNTRQLWQNTCASHSGNLLLKTLVDENFSSVLKDLFRVFKEPKYESLLLLKGGTRLVNFPDTRFCFFRDSCLSVLNNLSFLREICVDYSDNLKEGFVDFILSEELKNKLQDTIKLMDPICNLINTCQSPNCSAADAVQLWLSLTLPTNDYDSLIENRLKVAISDVAYAANFMHNQYEGKLLNVHQRRLVENFFEQEMNEDERQELALYFRNREKYTKYRESCKDPLSFWDLISLSLPNLSNFCKKLLMIPASTAQLEGLFSNWTYIHNSCRNRLGDNKSACLVDIYYSLKHIEGCNDYNM